MVGGLQMKKILHYSGLQNPSSKLEMAGVQHQGLDRHILSAQMNLWVSLHLPAGKFSGTRRVQRVLACLEQYRIWSSHASILHLVHLILKEQVDVFNHCKCTNHQRNKKVHSLKLPFLFFILYEYLFHSWLTIWKDEEELTYSLPGWFP